MTANSGSHNTMPMMAITTEMAAKKVALVPTTRFASAMSFAPMHWPMRIVAAMAMPNAAPMSRNMTVLAFEVAVRAASPRKRPTQMEFTEPFRDCRMFANRMGKAKRIMPLLIEPSVSERGAFMESGGTGGWGRNYGGKSQPAGVEAGRAVGKPYK